MTKNQIKDTLNGMTRKQLRSLAKQSSTPVVGRNKSDTVTLLTNHVLNGKLQFKIVAYFKLPSASPTGTGTPIFVKKIRTYKADKVIIGTK